MVNLVELQESEAHRRLKLLGTAIGSVGEAELRTRARQISLPVAVLNQWYASYLHGGFPALLPQWEPPSEATWALIQQRYTALGDLAEAETLSQEALCTLAANQGWTMRQTLRWLHRYRVGGMMGLAPAKRLVQSRAIPDLGILSERQRNELFRRYTLLGELAEQEHISNALLQKRAEAAGVSLRTLRDYHTRFRREGLAGLAPRGRADKGMSHLLSAHMVQFIEGLRLTHRDGSVRFIHELACQHAAARGDSHVGVHHPG